MPRAEVGTPKWLANKMKAKGLQKLRWYCQMCEKQCRDENGFKCHRMSEMHQRQMQLFAQRPEKFMDEFSREFEREFMRLVSTRYARTRVLANSVYCEVISDKQHIHMNSTIWVTLTEFVHYLARSHKVKLDKTPRGWYIEYIDSEKIERERQADARRKAEMTTHERDEQRIQEAVSEAKNTSAYQQPEYAPLQRKDGETITFKMPAPIKTSDGKHKDEINKVASNILLLKDPKASRYQNSVCGSSQTEKRKISALDRIMLENERRKAQRPPEVTQELQSIKVDASGDDLKQVNEFDTKIYPPSHPDADADWWVEPGIMVKVLHKDLCGGKYYKKKGEILKVSDRYAADIKMLEDGDVIRVDQDDLETVIPGINCSVNIVRGPWRGHMGTLEAVHIEKFCADVRITKGQILQDTGRSEVIIRNIPYESICKVYE